MNQRFESVVEFLKKEFDYIPGEFFKIYTEVDLESWIVRKGTGATLKPLDLDEAEKLMGLCGHDQRQLHDFEITIDGSDQIFIRTGGYLM